ncbi:MAG: HyaD/HybD family hydrogenase maturation endopeptidase [Desulfuromonas sp.]|nr:MAG: HyaD/HybD family hydrogenase maturation endopeptidase [Desulfuromonas sp.]
MGILVLGLGNALMSDDSVGVRAVARLQQDYRFPEKVKIVDGGTLGLDLLPFIEEADQLLIIDALEMKADPGSIFRLEGDEVPRAFASKLSVHQMGLQDLLAVADLQGYSPRELVFWGVQPASIEMTMEMSPPVAAALDELVQSVVDELARWGASLEKAA